MAILVSCRRLLTPIVTFLLRFGVGYREFSEVAKKVFVDVAAHEFGVRGRKTNASRIAIITGLPRKQVKRISDYDGIGKVTESEMTQASLVLAAWHSDPRFCKSPNVPRDLSLEGGKHNFHELVREHGRDVPSVAMLKELSRTGVIKKLKNKKIRAVSRTNLATGTDIESIQRAGAVLYHLASTVTNNLFADTAVDRKFERRSFTTNLDPQYIQDFRRFINLEGQRFVERIDNWIALHELPPSHFEKDQMTIGVGVYAFEDSVAVSD